MDSTISVVLASKEEVSMADSIASKARRKKIARASSKSEQSTYIVRS